MIPKPVGGEFIITLWIGICATGPGRARHGAAPAGLPGPIRSGRGFANSPWTGYDRIAGALVNLGYEISDQTVGNILHRHRYGLIPGRICTG